MKKDNIFWISYSDLMTSLFFIMLVLFVVTVGYLKVIQDGLAKTVEEQNKLLRLDQQFKPLEESGYFIYLQDCKKYIVKELMGVELFDPKQTVIKKEFIGATIQAGKELEKFLDALNRKNPDLSYLIVIEGNMANKFDMSIDENNSWGYEISYKRALAVYNLWNRNNINLRQYNAEIMLCGSGFNGLCRDESIEDNNKRFSIQIIPKVQNNIGNDIIY